MTDDFAGLEQEEGTSAPAPAAPAVDIEARLAAIEAATEERIKGFQRLLAGRDEELKAREAEIRELKTSGLSEDEREQLRYREIEEERDRLARELELIQLKEKYGDLLDPYQKLLNAQSAEEQLALLAALRAPAAPPAAPTPQAAPAPEPSDIDLNNPRIAEPEGITLPDGTTMTEDLADRILGIIKR